MQVKKINVNNKFLKSNEDGVISVLLRYNQHLTPY